MRILAHLSPGIFGIEKLEQLEDKLLIDHFLPDGGLEVRGFKEPEKKLVDKLKQSKLSRTMSDNLKIASCTISIRPNRDGRATGRPEMMCPLTSVLGPLVPKLIVPCNTMSLD